MTASSLSSSFIIPTRVGLGDKVLLYVFSILLAYLLISSKALLLLYVVGSLSAIVGYLHWDKQYWSRLGVPTAHGTGLFDGNTLQLYKKGMHVFDTENLHSLGPIFGAYMFDRKQLITTDLEFLREVCLKKFPNFQDRYTPLDPPKSHTAKESIGRLVLPARKGEEWKRVRNRVTPAFTTGKIKKLFPHLNKSANQMCEIVDYFIDQGRELSLKDLFARFALDVVVRAGFSQDVGTFDSLIDGTQTEHPFLTNTKRVFEAVFMGWRAFISAFFPFTTEMVGQLLGVDIFASPGHLFFRKFLLKLYDERKAAAENKAGAIPADIFQLLLEAEEESENGENKVSGASSNAEDADIIHAELQPRQSQQGEKVVGVVEGRLNASKKLTKTELLAQSMIIMLAGNETTSSALQFIVFALAAHPEIQERLREEVLRVTSGSDTSSSTTADTTITYEHTTQMPYLTAVIFETLRMFPIAARMDRECTAPITIKGIPLRRGDLVVLPIYAVHHDPRHYPQPERFDPERFLPEARAARDPMTFLGFGYGPRNCIGMRLAEFELRVAVATLMKKYRLLPAANSPVGMRERRLKNDGLDGKVSQNF